MPGGRSRKELMNDYSSESSDDDDDVYGSSDSSTDTDTERVMCKCGEPNTAHMIGCDGRTCQYEWLHFKCVGIHPENIPTGRWLCEDCQHKEEKEEALHRIPSGQFAVPVLNPSKRRKWVKELEEEQNNLEKETEPKMPTDLYILPTPNSSNERNTQASTDSDSPVPSSSISFPDTRKETDILTDVEKRECNATVTKSLSDAERQLASNLKQASHAVVHEGKSVGDAAMQFCVGRYVLGDYVKDQLKLNLTNACQDVISKKYTVEKASLVYGVIPGILEERVKVEKDALWTTDGQKMPGQPMSSFFEENLQQACMDIMSSRCTLSEACRIYKIHSATLKSKLKTVLVLTTAEENDLVKMCIKMAVLGHSALIKSTVISNVKALFEDEERRGIRRLHAFPDNTPDNFWWQSFRSRHPEFKSISYDDASQVTSDVILKQSTSQNMALNNVGQEIRPNLLPSNTDKVYYILPTPRASNKQFILVKQNSLPDNQVPPVTDAVSDVNPMQSKLSSRPEPLSSVSNYFQDDQQSSDSSKNTPGLNRPSLEAADGNVLQPSLDGSTVEIEDPNVVVAAEEVEQGTDTFGFLSSKTEQPSLVLGANEVIFPSLNVAGDEVVQTVTNEAAQPDSVIGDDDLPQLETVVAANETVQTGQASGSELSQPNVMIEVNQADQPDQVVANEVGESSLTIANDNAHMGLVVPTSEALQPYVNENPGLIVGANEVIQPSQDTAPTETPVAANAAQLNQTTSDGAVWPNLSTSEVVHSNRCVVAAGNEVVQPCFFGPSTIIIAANQIVQPNQFILAKNIVQPNLAVNNSHVLPQNYVNINKVADPNSVGSGHPAGTGKVVQPSQEHVAKYKMVTAAKHDQYPTSGGISCKEMQAYLDATGGNIGIPLLPPQPGSSTFPKSSQDPPKNSNSTHNGGSDFTGVFVPKHKINQTVPDALTCLEKTLTEEQKESFAFRLQIGDDHRDDLLYNAWKALKRLYHHKNIYAMHNKLSPHIDHFPPTFELPVASNLLVSSPLMDPANHSNGQVKGQPNSEHGCNILAELRRGRKRRRIASKLARREADRTRRKDVNRFLEPWKYEIKKPNKRKSCMTRYAGNSLHNPLSDKAETEIQDPNEN